MNITKNVWIESVFDDRTFGRYLIEYNSSNADMAWRDTESNCVGQNLYKVKIHDLEKGFEKLQELVDKWEGPEAQASHFNLKLFVDKDNYEAVEGLANVQNKTAQQLAVEVVRNYVASQQNGKSE
ncbi:hypothetical protein QQ045_026950 [Rhodiola kirilowii]